MFDFKRLVDNCTQIGNEAAKRTLEAGRPVTSWDVQRKRVVRIYPDGRVEDVPELKKESS
jgi:hypothetical protein